MKVTRKNGVTTCLLSHAERTTLERANSIVEQLAYHHRDTNGEELETIVGVIDGLLTLTDEPA